MKIRYLLIAGLLLSTSSIAFAEHYNIGKTYTIRSAAQGGSKEEAELANLMKEMDKSAAARGDKLSMGSIAEGCLKIEDYACAYKNILISLTSTYWWTDFQLPTRQLAVHDKARDGLSDAEAEKITAEVKAHFAEELETAKKKLEEEIKKHPDQEESLRASFPMPRDDIGDKDPAEWEEMARKGNITAAGHLAKKSLEEADYPAAYKWATLASMGASWQILGESMLSYRDQARKQMSADELRQADQELRELLLNMKYPDKSPKEIQSAERALQKKLKNLQRRGIISKARF